MRILYFMRMYESGDGSFVLSFFRSIFTSHLPAAAALG